MKKALIKIQTFLALTLIAACFIQCSKNIKDDSIPKVRLSINRMDAEGIDKKTVSNIAEILHKELQAIKGANRVVYREKDGVSKSTNRQLVGRISKLGKSYVLSIKIIEGEKGKVLFNRTVTAKESSIDDSLEDIAEEIGDEDGIWE